MACGHLHNFLIDTKNTEDDDSDLLPSEEEIDG